MNTATVNVDPALEREAQTVLDGLGLTMTAAVNMFLRQTIQAKAIPFQVDDPDLMTEEEFLAKYDRGMAEIRAGKGIVKTMEELEAMAGDEG